MQKICLSLIATLLLVGCSNKPEPAPKPPARHIVETQHTPPYIVTIWSTTPEVPVGTNLFKLQFQTMEKQLIAPEDSMTVSPVLVETGKTPIPGRADVKASQELGIYDVTADLTTAGRWRFNVSFGSHHIVFYYNAKQGVRHAEDANETGRSR